ncbi:MAG: hypothetical protein KDK36_02945 [Leptospiraceae bacterium]|nr:hypothetical protein [Leptospiraceae bacterium]
MKYLILMLILSLGIDANPISKDCTFNGKKLSGRVKIVNHAGDFNVQVVNHAADLNVLLTNGMLSNCGEWQYVQTGYDFTVVIVNYAPDFRIQFVQAMPGVQ